jgi:hypothetical protein
VLTTNKKQKKNVWTEKDVSLSVAPVKAVTLMLPISAIAFTCIRVHQLPYTPSARQPTIATHVVGLRNTRIGQMEIATGIILTLAQAQS